MRANRECLDYFGTLHQGDPPPCAWLDRGQSPLTASEPGSANARISGYTLPSQGIYYLRMERQNGTGSGGFTLLLTRAD